MRVLCLVMVLAVAALTWLGGCNGDDSGGGSLLAQGTLTIPATSPATIATLQATAPGTLQCRLTWSGDPAEFEAAFKHVASGDIHGMTIGPSPLVSTAAVSSADVAAGADWQFLAANPASTAVSVQYEIRFFPN
jgi:hypothetical protein